MQEQSRNDSPEQTGRLAQHEAYWRRFGVRRASRSAPLATIASGWPALDAILPGAGFPLAAVTELLTAASGIGELSLLLPTLAARMRAASGRRIALVAPPYRPNTPALAGAGIDCARLPVIACPGEARVWAIEQMARSKAFAAFVVWGEALDFTALRRLQLAAEQAVCPVFVYRDIRRAAERSPAALRLAVAAGPAGQQLEIIKCRGPAGARVAGLVARRDAPWRMAGANNDTTMASAPARNDNETHQTHDSLAGPAFSPLGAR